MTTKPTPAELVRQANLVSNLEQQFDEERRKLSDMWKSLGDFKAKVNIDGDVFLVEQGIKFEERRPNREIKYLGTVEEFLLLGAE